MARFTNGWIKIYRSILEHPVSQRGLFTFGIFIRLLYMANWKESSVVFGGKKITLQPGQLVTGLRELSPDEDEDPYLNKARVSLKYLVLCDAIEQVSNNQGRLITIRNWAKYQNGEDDEQATTTASSQAGYKQATSNSQLSKEVKKVRKKKKEETPIGAIPELQETGTTPLLERVSQELQRQWIETFPDPAWIKKEIKKARAYEILKKLNYQDYGRYLNGWLGRADHAPNKAKTDHPTLSFEVQNVPGGGQDV